MTEILLKSKTDMTPVRHELSNFEKHNLAHISFQTCCKSCVKGKTHAEPHKRTERIIEDNEFPVIQCNYLMLKVVAGTTRLKVLNMHVRHSDTACPQSSKTKKNMFATMWAVEMFNFLGLTSFCSVIL